MLWVNTPISEWCVIRPERGPTIPGSRPLERVASFSLAVGGDQHKWTKKSQPIGSNFGAHFKRRAAQIPEHILKGAHARDSQVTAATFSTRQMTAVTFSALNDSVLYHSLLELASRRRFWGRLPGMTTTAHVDNSRLATTQELSRQPMRNESDTSG